MNIGGKKRESTGSTEYVKKVGLFEATVLAINPGIEEYRELFAIDLKEDSKVTEYLGTTKDDDAKLRIDVWLEEVKSKDRYKVVFFLEDKEKEKKDGTKKQYINSVGSCAWASDPNDLPSWFTGRDYRVAHVGEEDLYNFLRVWLGNLDLRDAETTLSLDWKKMMKGNVKDLQNQVNGEWCTSIVALATVKTVEKDGDIKEYQSVYNGSFLPAYTLKNFRVTNFNDAQILEGLRKKKSKDLKPFERFAINVTGEYGCKEFFTLKDLKDYNPDDNLVASDKTIADDDGEF